MLLYENYKYVINHKVVIKYQEAQYFINQVQRLSPYMIFRDITASQKLQFLLRISATVQ